MYFNIDIQANPETGSSLFSNLPKSEISLFNQSTIQPAVKSESSLFASKDNSFINGRPFNKSESTINPPENKVKIESISFASNGQSSSVFNSQTSNFKNKN